MSDNHGTVSYLVQETSGESQQTSTHIVEDKVESEVSQVYVETPVNPEVEESLEDCE